jgi:hypothetical protein
MPYYLFIGNCKESPGSLWEWRREGRMRGRMAAA